MYRIQQEGKFKEPVAAYVHTHLMGWKRAGGSFPEENSIFFVYFFANKQSKEKLVICLGGFTSSAAALKFSDSVEVLRYEDGFSYCVYR